MVNYSCSICEKVFTQKGHFEAHQNRKRPCKKDNTIEALVTQKVQEALANTNLVIHPPVVVEAPKNIVVEPSPKLRMIDLFAGTGAFTHAFEQTGKVTCVFANDMMESSKKMYDENFRHKLTLQDLNTVKVEDIPAHDILTGGFPCFVAGTRVLTEGGYKPIESVTLEDRVLTHTGRFQPILNLQQKSGATTLYSIDTQYHPHSLHCTEEHPFYARIRTRQWDSAKRIYTYTMSAPEWIPAHTLTKEHFTGLPIDTQSIIPTRSYQIRTNATSTKILSITLDQLDQWFMMGYFLGDGWIEEPTKIRFAINNKDEAYVVGRISTVLPITDKLCDTGQCRKFGCANELWASILKDFGKYSHGKCVPEWVQTSPKEYIQEFLRGYQTADGCINPSSKGLKDHHIQFTTVSPAIAYGIQRLYLKLGQLCSITYHPMPPTCVIQGRTVNQRSTYKLRILLNRQRLSASFLENSYAWFKIQGVTHYETEPQTVYNFEVETDNSYCVENTIVHNCQPFSIAGKQEGFDDERSNVFWKILAIIDHHTPRCVVLENVKNLVSHDDGRTFEIIKKNLTDRGYHIQTKVLNTSDITGVPQHRERIYIVCLKDKSIFDKFSLEFPKIEKKAITTMLETTVPAKYYYTEASSTWPLVSAGITKQNTIYQYRRVYVRENKSNECPTLTANMGGGGHNVPLILDTTGIRKLTPRECFNFQGFPQTYKFPELSDTHLYKLAGNAVSVPVVILIANRLIPLL
jgi:DNA (cytosine-5)-methyltransferase 1